MLVDTIAPSLSNSMPMDLTTECDSSPCNSMLMNLLTTRDRLRLEREERAAARLQHQCQNWRRSEQTEVKQARLDRWCVHCESSVTFNRSMGVELDSEGSIVSTCTEHEFCQIWNVMGTFWYPFVYFKFSVYGHTYVSRHTYTHVLQCSPASVGLAQACPN